MNDESLTHPVQRVASDGGKFARLAPLMTIMALLCLTIYLLLTYRSIFHSDAADRSLLAEEMLSSHQLFPAGWKFVNGDLLFVTPHLFIVALIPIFGNTMLVNRLASLIGAVIFIFLLRKQMTRLALSSLGSHAFLALATLGLSMDFMQYAYAETAYISQAWMVVACFLLLLPAAGLGIHSTARLILLGIVVFFGTVSNPTRIGICVLLPFVVAYPFIHAESTRLIFSVRALSGARARPLLVLLGSGALAAIVYWIWLLPNVINVDTVVRAQWATPGQMLRNLYGICTGLPAFFGADFQQFAYDSFAKRLGEIYGFSLFVLLAASTFHGLTLRTRRPLVFGVAVAAIFAFLAPAIPLITKFPIWDNHSSGRYLTSWIVLSIPLAAAAGDALIRARPRIGSAALSAFVLLGFASFFCVMMLPDTRFDQLLVGNMNQSWKPRSLEVLARRLREEGLTFGYASYWNADAASVYADGKTIVAPLDLNTSPPLPFPFNRALRWYRSDFHRGDVFLVLNPGELSQFNSSDWSKRLGEPLRAFDVAEYRVLVYPQNFADVFDWKGY